MNEKMKKYVGISAIILFLTASYSLVKFANSYNASIQPSSFRSFAVNAEGKATVIPDIAKFSYSVITEGDKNIQASTEKNTTKANDIIIFLKGSKVDAKDIKTAMYNVEPRTEYYSCKTNADGTVKPCPPSEIVGYTIRQTMEVKIRDFATIGDILNGVVIKGANNVSDLQFTSEDPTKNEDVARNDAIAKAIKKAGDIATAGGFTLGRLISIEEYSGSMPNYGYAGGYAGVSMMKSVDSQATPTIEPGSQETKVNITLRYEIQ